MAVHHVSSDVLSSGAMNSHGFVSGFCNLDLPSVVFLLGEEATKLIPGSPLLLPILDTVLFLPPPFSCHRFFWDFMR